MPEGIFHDSFGRPLSREQVERIRALVAEHLGDAAEEAEPLAVRSAIAEERMRAMEAQGVPLEEFLKRDVPRTILEAVSRFGLTRQIAQEIAWARDHTGVHVTGFSDELSAKLVRQISQATRTRTAPRDLARQLFDTFDNFNRDWRTIATTETAANHNNAFILNQPVGSYVCGQSYPDACQWCRQHMHGKVLKVTTPPESFLERASVKRDWNSIWPGKSNFGKYQSLWSKSGEKRAALELWSPAVIAHPNCRCYWVAFDPEIHIVDAMGFVRIKPDAARP